jgi:hypothetical protein
MEGALPDVTSCQLQYTPSREYFDFQNANINFFVKFFFTVIPGGTGITLLKEKHKLHLIFTPCHALGPECS